MKLLNDGHDPNFGCFIHNEIQLQKVYMRKGFRHHHQKHWSGKTQY